VIMDLTMPGSMGGKDATRKILEIDPDAKVIVSSGYSNDPIMSNYREYGFSGVITKPYNVDQLKSEIARVVKLPLNR
jgi:two-component system, cell cycle sensor histidine kinase and response regulator CckA